MRSGPASPAAPAAPADDGPGADRAVPLGRVIDAWGVRGWIKVEPYADVRDTALVGARRWHVARLASAAHSPVDCGLEIERARRHGATVVAKAVGIDDRDAALALKGAQVGVRRVDFPPAPAGEWYWLDLVGCEVSNPAGEALGRVTAVDDHGAHAILATDAGLLIPFVDAYVREVAPAERRIVVDWRAEWSR
jgi:16S rRNA processing protein RimM